jgi:hypothetical protein
MRIRSAAMLALLVITAALSAADPYASLAFTDGKARSQADFAGQTVVVIPLNGKC